MIAYRFLTSAEEELSEAGVFHEANSVGLGADFLNEVQRVIDIVREYPKIRQALGRDVRRIVLRRFPFSLIYSVEIDSIVIVAVAHQRRRPDYWKDRV